jgi:hypothetical protein
MIQKFNRERFLVSLVTYLILSALSFLIFSQFEGVKVKDILVSYATFLPLDKVDASTVMFIILWIAPQIYLMTYGFNIFHRYFQANIIYFVTRGEKISKSYWLILKKILIELTLMVLIRILVILVTAGSDCVGRLLLLYRFTSFPLVE